VCDDRTTKVCYDSDTLARDALAVAAALKVDRVSSRSAERPRGDS
jgi:hypothetical protein